MSQYFKSFASLAALALASCTVPHTTQAQNHKTVATAAQNPAGPALWSLTDEDTTVYLFGTIHLLPEGEVWFDERIASAFDSSEELVFEVDIDEVTNAQQQVAQMSVLAGGSTSRSLMTEEDRAQYEAALATLGIPAEALDPVEPWAISLNLAMLPLLQSGWTPDQGVEMVLRQRGEQKKRLSLESVSEQVGFFDDLPMEHQLTMLDYTVENLDSVVPMLDSVKAEWLEGDAAALATILNNSMTDPVLYERLLVNRNRNWVDWIEQRMDEPGKIFIAVGAGHLAGEGSVQSLLAERGLIVERIEN